MHRCEGGCIHACGCELGQYVELTATDDHTHLVLPPLGGDDSVEWDHEHHHSEPGEDGGSHGEPEEDEGEHYLEWGGPDHVQIGHEVHEHLSIH